MTSGGPGGSSGSVGRGPSDRFESIVEAMGDGVFVLGADGTITYVNDAIESFTGIDREALIGASIDRLVDAGVIDDAEFGQFAEALETLRDDAKSEHRMTVETIGESKVELRLCRRGRTADGDGIVGTIRDVTGRERALETIERQQWALYRLYEADVNTELTAEEKIERALDVGCEFLDLPIGFLTSVNGDVRTMMSVGGWSDYSAIEPYLAEPTEARIGEAMRT